MDKLYEGTGWGFLQSLIIWAAPNSGPLTSTPFPFVYTMNEMFSPPQITPTTTTTFHDSKLFLNTPTKPKQERVPAEHHPITPASTRNFEILIEIPK